MGVTRASADRHLCPACIVDSQSEVADMAVYSGLLHRCSCARPRLATSRPRPRRISRRRARPDSNGHPGLSGDRLFPVELRALGMPDREELRERPSLTASRSEHLRPSMSAACGAPRVTAAWYSGTSQPAASGLLTERPRRWGFLPRKPRTPAVGAVDPWTGRRYGGRRGQQGAGPADKLEG